MIAGGLIWNTLIKVDHRPLPVPRETNISQIQSWMSVRYISQAYNIPEQIILEKLQINIPKVRGLPIASLAKQSGRSVAELIIKIQQVVLDFRHK